MQKTLVFLLIILPFLSISQNRKTINKWNSDFFNLYDKDIDQAFEIAQKALSASRKISYTLGEGAALYRIGIAYDIKLQADSARKYLYQGINVLKKSPDKSEIADAYNNLGAHYYYQSQYLKAIYAHKKAIQYYDLSKEPGGASRALNNIGICYKNLGEMDQALQTYYQSLEIGKRLKDSMTISISYASISGLYIELGDLDKALQFNFLSESAINRTDNYTLITVYFARGEIYQQAGRYEKAQKAYLKGMKLAKKSKNLERLQYFYRSLAELNIKLNNSLEAIDYLELYDSLRNQVYNKDRNEFLASFEKKLENQKIRLEKSKAKEELKTSNFFLLSAILLIILLVGIIGFTFFLLQLRRKRLHQAKEHLNDVKLLSKEMHHRIKNNLQLIASMISIELRDLDDKTQERLDHIIGTMQIMTKIHESLHSESGEEHIDLQVLFNLLQNQSEQLLNGLKCDFKAENIGVDLNSGISIGLLINELVTNSVKHAFKFTDLPSITIRLVKDADQLAFSYNDNGIGADSSALNEISFGSKFLKTICKKLGAEPNINNIDGFTFELNIIKFAIL